MMSMANDVLTPESSRSVGAGSTIPASMTEDAFLGGKLSILQPEKGYRAGIDAVFLAATIPVVDGETVFEAGIGAGVVSLCLLARNPLLHVTGMEIATRYSVLCEQNAKRNNFSDNVHVITADVKDTMPTCPSIILLLMLLPTHHILRMVKLPHRPACLRPPPMPLGRMIWNCGLK
jgi:Methyltransferase small domain